MDKNEAINRQKVIDEITRKLEEIGKQLQQDKDMNPQDKAVQVDVMLDTLHFLQDYDENVKVLNQYWMEKRRRQKFEQPNR